MRAAYVLLAILLLAACTGTGINKPPTIFEGKDGLIISFYEGAPPDTLVPDSQTTIGLLIENKGALDIDCDIECGHFRVFASPPLEIAKTSGTLREVLDGNGALQFFGKETYLSGGRAFVSLDATTGDPQQTVSSVITVNACYPYQTRLTTGVCIETAHFTVEPDARGCEVEPITLSSQGAPVAIKRIEQTSIFEGDYTRPRFKIFVENIGNGAILDGTAAGLTAGCTANTLEKSDELAARVVVEHASVGGKQLNCQGKSIPMTGKSNVIECILEPENSNQDQNRFQRGASSNIVTTLDLTLTYGYQTSASKTVKVEVTDSPPRVTRFVVPDVVQQDFTTLSAKVVSEDNFGLVSLSVMAAGNTYTSESCYGDLRCERQFTLSKSQLGDISSGTIKLEALATDTNGKTSRISTAFIAINTTPTITPNPAQINEDNTLLSGTAQVPTGILVVQLLDVDGKVVETHNCEGRTSCFYDFTVSQTDLKEITFSLRAISMANAIKQTSGYSEPSTPSAPIIPSPCAGVCRSNLNGCDVDERVDGSCGTGQLCCVLQS